MATLNVDRPRFVDTHSQHVPHNLIGRCQGAWPVVCVAWPSEQARGVIPVAHANCRQWASRCPTSLASVGAIAVLHCIRRIVWPKPRSRARTKFRFRQFAFYRYSIGSIEPDIDGRLPRFAERLDLLFQFHLRRTQLRTKSRSTILGDDVRYERQPIQNRYCAKYRLGQRL